MCNKPMIASDARNWSSLKSRRFSSASRGPRRGPLCEQVKCAYNSKNSTYPNEYNGFEPNIKWKILSIFCLSICVVFTCIPGVYRSANMKRQKKWFEELMIDIKVTTHFKFSYCPNKISSFIFTAWTWNIAKKYKKAHDLPRNFSDFAFFSFILPIGALQYQIQQMYAVKMNFEIFTVFY